MLVRPRRLRENKLIRDLVSETHLSIKNLIQPYFLVEQPNDQQAINGFTGVYRWGLEKLKKQIASDLERGLQSFLLFGSSLENEKDSTGSVAQLPESLLPTAIRELKKTFGESILLFSDVCLCPFTDHGHCGVVQENRVENNSSLEPLSKIALVHAEAGVDFVAPSDMMDGRVLAIRNQLDSRGFFHTGILSYTAKYASNYYGPFREALGSSPKAQLSEKLKDRSTYQMDFRNSTEALRELEEDVKEGADMVMVKPALAYLDVICRLKQDSKVPVVAYSVSAEFEMVKSLVAKGLADEAQLVIENLTAIRRAGADLVVTYHASEVAEKGWFR